VTTDEFRDDSMIVTIWVLETDSTILGDRTESSQQASTTSAVSWATKKTAKYG